MFTTITGLPVVESAATRKLVGVVSKKDLEKDGKTVSEVGRCFIHNCWLRCGVKTWPSPGCPRHGGPCEDGLVQDADSDPVSALPLDLPIILQLMPSCCFGLWRVPLHCCSAHCWLSGIFVRGQTQRMTVPALQTADHVKAAGGITARQQGGRCSVPDAQAQSAPHPHRRQRRSRVRHRESSPIRRQFPLCCAINCPIVHSMLIMSWSPVLLSEAAQIYASLACTVALCTVSCLLCCAGDAHGHLHCSGNQLWQRHRDAAIVGMATSCCRLDVSGLRAESIYQTLGTVSSPLSAACELLLNSCIPADWGHFAKFAVKRLWDTYRPVTGKELSSATGIMTFIPNQIEQANGPRSSL